MKTKIIASLLLMLIFNYTSFAQEADTAKNLTLNSEEIIIEESESPVFTIVEMMPKYPGGDKEMYAFLANNIKYPAYAKENGITGTVFITFVVENNGKISNAKILKDIGGGCGYEALRVVNSMPKWKPGKQGGKPVRVQFNLPLNFTLSDDGK